MSQTKAQLIDGKSAEIEFTGGSASGPAISFTGDTNTGIYSPGADQVAVATNGTGRLFIDASGNVGVGGSATDVLSITRSANSAGGISIVNTNNAQASAISQLYIQGGNNAHAQLKFSVNSLDTSIRGQGDGSLAIIQGVNERMRLDSAGLVGIGTSAPDSNLEIVGGTTTAGPGAELRLSSRDQTIAAADEIIGSVTFKNNDASSGMTGYMAKIDAASNRIFDGDPASGMNLRFFAGTAADGVNTPPERMRLTSAGRLGIGTTAPSQTLGVAGGVGIGNQLSTGTTGSIKLTSSGGTNYIQSGQNTSNASAAPLVFTDYNAFNEWARIDSSGRVGIGTSSPAVNLQVNAASDVTIALSNSSSVTSGNRGNISCFNSAVSSVGVIRFAAVTDNVGTEIQFHTRPAAGSLTQSMTLDSTGRLGVGTTTPQALLHLEQTSPVDGRLARIVSTGVGAGFLGVKSTGNTFIDANTLSTALEFRTQDTERARIDSSGRLLVGTSTVRTTGWTTQGAGEIFQELTNYGGITCFTNANDAEGTTVTLGKSRGTSAGSNTVVQNNDRLASLIFQGTDGTNSETAAAIHCYVDGTPGANDMPGRLTFSTTADGASSPTERMRISQNGFTRISDNGSYVGSSTAGYHEVTSSNPGTRALLVTNQGTISSGSENGLHVLFRYSSPDNNVQTFISCEDSTVTRMRVYADGDVWTSDAGILTSDATLKRDITDVTPKLNDVMNLRVRNFHWEESYHPNKQDKKLIGFIAQEMEEVFPGLVSEHKISGGKPILDENGNETGETTPEVFKKGIKEAKLLPILVKALQEAVERIETLEGMVAVNNITIDEQQHQLSTLAARLTALENA
jgi:hypothetical protein